MVCDSQDLPFERNFEGNFAMGKIMVISISKKGRIGKSQAKFVPYFNFYL